jgi:methyl-accepting chemotaxis protein
MAKDTEHLPVDVVRERQQKGFHFTSLRLMLYVMSPYVFLSYGMTMIRKEFAWQAVLQFVMGLVAIGAWFFSNHLTRRGRIDPASYFAFGGLLVFVGFSMLTTYGNSATLVLTALACVIYASLFSRGQLATAVTGVCLFYTLGEVSLYFEWWPKIVLTPKEVFFRGMPFFALIMLGIVLILQHSKRLTNLLLNDTQRFATEQRSIVVSASQLGRTLDAVVGEIEHLSTELIQRTSAQSEAVGKMDNSIEELREIGKTSFGAASQTRKAVFELQASARRANDHLRQVEERFGSIEKSYGYMRSQFDDLSSQAVRIEGILHANREIAAQIKILAINAAIQAAKAGSYGAGFRVVAVELKAMIQLIEASLSEGRKLLSDIRMRAKESSLAVEQNTGLLERHAAELEETTRLIDSLEAQFVSAASQMTAITSAAETQGDRLDLVATGATDVETAADALSHSTARLQSAVQRIVQSHVALAQVLGTSDVGAKNLSPLR